ncbi:MAG: SEC-C domain-containing protein [Chloroflexi bacterium]|nr:SEC-C domain-containing protein [Chloroflexota bacterium]
MKKKIGRNELCPCGSGKKYKKCCLNKILQPSHLKSLEAEFAQYDQLELIATLGGLQVYPENHSQNLRLETASGIACSIKNSGTKKVELETLQETLNKFLPSRGSIGMMEDPLENLFTENIIFHGGNYIVYPGIDDSGSFILTNLFDAIFQIGEGLIQNFKDIVGISSISMLALSNEVARRLGHSRYMDSPERNMEDIKVPEQNQLHKFRDAVIFTKQEIDILLYPLGANYTCLEPFINQIGFTFSEEDPWKNPLFIRPLIEMDDKIIMARPISVTSVIRHFIWVISEKYQMRKVLAYNYRQSLMIRIYEYMKRFSLAFIDMRLPHCEKELPIEEGVFQIDFDKLAYVQLIADDARNYNRNEPYDMLKIDEVFKDIFKRQEFIAKWLIENNPCKYLKLFVILVIGKIGRTIFYPSKKLNDTLFLEISAEDLETIAHLRDCDNLTFWKYANSLKKLTESTSIIATSSLDLFANYLDHHHSFYLTEGKQPNLINVIPGYGRNLKIKAARVCDIHAALQIIPKGYTSVFRWHKDDYIPIYLPERDVGRILKLLVEGYHQPIWIRPKDDLDKIPTELREIYLEFTQMLAYWLWQLTPSLKPHFEPLGTTPINILFDLENSNKWIDINNTQVIDYEVLIFDSIVNKPNIIITIPYAIQSYLYSADNEGERLLIDKLMELFGVMLEKDNLPNNLGGVERKSILDLHAPHGMKKKLFLINTDKDIALNPKNLSPFRKLQEHNMQEQLDGLVKELGMKLPDEEIFVNKDERTCLCNKIVEIYFNRLKSLLSKFNWKHIIEYLIASNEAIWHHQTTTSLTIPTTIECYSDINSYVELTQKDYRDIGHAALATRTLIEIISAIPPRGDKIISIDEMDELLAVTTQLLNWALISEHIYFNIYSPELILLPSGRIAIDNRKIMDESWNSFTLSKAFEKVVSAEKRFEKHFKHQKTEEEFIWNKQECEDAFSAEFGLTMTQIGEFHGCLSSIGFEQNALSPNLHLSALKNKLKELLKWSENDLNCAIDLFSLKPREYYDKAPEGFNVSKDIYPWRYNRQLSYMRRPLIIGPEPVDDSIVFWGPRHVSNAGISFTGNILMGRYEAKSEKLKTFIGKLRNQAGKEFLNETKIWFEENTNWQIEPEVPIKPGKPLSSEKDLGDIDLLAIDITNKRIFSIECKNINYARIPSEISNEMERLLKGKNGEDSWADKHLKRDKWLKDNFNILSKVYALPSKPFQIYSLFVMAEEIPSTYIGKMPLPCFSFSQLKREGVNLFSFFK